MLNENVLKSLKDIHWKTQDSTADSLLFYRLGNEPDALRLFEQRISSAKFNWLIVNKTVPGLPKNSSIIPEENWPEIQKEVLDVLYPLPNLKIMALTGTNGKTTTTDLVLQLGELIGKKGLSVGTLGLREKNKTILEFGLTSPPFIDLRKYLHIYGKNKDFCVLEASSHALIQDRLYKIEFDGAGWLSFSQDHLDYHRSMDAYFDAKCLILNHLKSDAKLFVPKEQQDLFQKLAPVSSKTAQSRPVSASLPLFLNTKFNRNNLEVAVALIEDVFETKLSVNFEKLEAPEGRFYIRPYKSSYIVVDFAHTPDALENICQGIKESFPGYKLKVLFGCGGDRDRTKRPLMGRVVDKLADHIYVTSDNPRSEEPEKIISDIMAGIKQKNVTIEVERPKATQKAFLELNDKEVLLLAGKGHEDYILIKGVKHPYSDVEQVEKFIKDQK